MIINNSTILTWIGCLFLGILWDVLLALNTRLTASDKSKYINIFISSVVLTIVWGFIVKSVSVDGWLIIPYSIACGIGNIIGVMIHKKMSITRRK